MIYFLTVNYYSTDLVTKLINSISTPENIPYQIVIVNNSPDDYAIATLKTASVFILDAGSNLGFGQACNLGIEWIYAQNSQAIVWIINPDAYLVKTSLEDVSLFFKTYPELSIVGTIIYTPDQQVWFAGGYFRRQTGTILTEDNLNTLDKAYINCDWVSGCSLIINLDKFDQCPKFDPVYFLYYEDFDFCQRYASLGHLIVITKEINIVHQPSTITNRNTFNKFKYSTFSYLITLERYTNKFILLIRLMRLIAYALMLIIVKPKTAFGKIYGILLYLRRSLLL